MAENGSHFVYFRHQFWLNEVQLLVSSPRTEIKGSKAINEIIFDQYLIMVINFISALVKSSLDDSLYSMSEKEFHRFLFIRIRQEIRKCRKVAI